MESGVPESRVPASAVSGVLESRVPASAVSGVLESRLLGSGVLESRLLGSGVQESRVLDSGVLEFAGLSHAVDRLSRGLGTAVIRPSGFSAVVRIGPGLPSSGREGRLRFGCGR